MVFDFLRSSVAGLSLCLAAFAGAAQAADLPSKKLAPVAPIPPSITWFDVAVSIKA